MTGSEHERQASIAEIQSGIEHTRGQFGDTVDAHSGEADRSKAPAKSPVAVVASVAGVTVAGLIWWRRRRRR
ncbi:hypothetical protein [Mycobacterium shimoidei]|uniref:DUF3618 domain-containing protein n=1 Tax=Mycobacterium shimoidei TaxID=29313 RepID=A0A1E3TL69_MYCSH|nr:hypothetical protein [Mycobacterium shimoidei]MCV7259839.1 hypothetical protein [Mycobacterium shimoidei]ODR15100.1 hypothetical protein BHQ16_03535 [Mycobacterium shimoidei]ORW79267.1 hypothetical protein AWC26_16950 [Mycobacterium shimoidei]SRX94615.1 hypothetical protein MSP7336_02874 [Mycobacterium shimoidei]